MNDQTREDLTKAELIAFPLLAIMLLVVFRGVIAAAIPLVIGVVSILGTLFALRIMAELVDTSLFALNIATALSLGLAVDYALLMVSRYREELESRRERPRRRTGARSRPRGRTVLFSGLTVAAAMIALIIFPQRFLYSVAVAGATVAILASVVTLLAVPALLSLLGERINSLSIRRGPGRVRLIRRLVPARMGGHAPPGGGRARNDGFPPRRRGSAPLHGPHRPERGGGAALLSRRTW